MRPTHGAAHLSMYPIRQGRLASWARRKTPAEQVRTGKIRSIRSTVSRIALAGCNGPKYFTPLRRSPRITITRGYFSFMVTASHGYDLSSRYMMLNRGVNSLIQVYSSWMASCSEVTTVHSIAAAVCTMVCVLGGSVLGFTKYELRRERRLLALPT